MKLFVVGESSPNPSDWSIWTEWSLVIANDENEAREVCGKSTEPVTEIPMDKPLHLVTMSEPGWGDDL